mmetsp:Transcript_23484/g.65558  ORF Transcript_23484/g.65558 Transcript_23484/m.65558 type:complete len:206 (+) Transcript_23484:777-1394(+)
MLAGAGAIVLQEVATGSQQMIRQDEQLPPRYVRRLAHQRERIRAAVVHAIILFIQRLAALHRDVGDERAFSVETGLEVDLPTLNILDEGRTSPLLHLIEQLSILLDLHAFFILQAAVRALQIGRLQRDGRVLRLQLDAQPTIVGGLGIDAQHLALATVVSVALQGAQFDLRILVERHAEPVGREDGTVVVGVEEVLQGRSQLLQT